MSSLIFFLDRREHAPLMPNFRGVAVCHWRATTLNGDLYSCHPLQNTSETSWSSFVRTYDSVELRFVRFIEELILHAQDAARFHWNRPSLLGRKTKQNKQTKRSCFRSDHLRFIHNHAIPRSLLSVNGLDGYLFIWFWRHVIRTGSLHDDQTLLLVNN